MMPGQASRPSAFNWRVCSLLDGSSALEVLINLCGVTRRTKRQREKLNSPVVQVVQLESPLERLSDCRTVPYLRFFLVRNEEVAGSIPVSSTKLLCFAKAG
jgi:hypothetical protein